MPSNKLIPGGRVDVLAKLEAIEERLLRRAEMIMNGAVAAEKFSAAMQALTFISDRIKEIKQEVKDRGDVIPVRTPADVRRLQKQVDDRVADVEKRLRILNEKSDH